VQKAEGASGRNQVRGVYCTLWVVRKSQQLKPQLPHFCETKEKNLSGERQNKLRQRASG